MNIEMIEAAEARIGRFVRCTPLMSSPFLDQIAGRRVFVKPECLQHTGSFKYRGAKSAVTALSGDALKKGVIAFSSGNHAQGVALAAKEAGSTAVIVMPCDAPKLKIDNTRALGAEVILYDRETQDRDQIGADLAQARGLTLIKPYDEPEVIAGQGTTGLEIARQAARLGIETADVLICCGGGGLTSGIALALQARAPAMRPRPVEPVGFDDVARSLVAGTLKSNALRSGTLCDAIVTPTPGDITFPIMAALCGPGLAVTDEQCLQAMALAFERLKIVLEPGGAAALAAALFQPGEISGDAVIVVASGGNVDPSVFAMALECLSKPA